jgi:hypothetical protein
VTRDDRTDDVLRALGEAAPRPPPPSARLEALLAATTPVATRRPARDTALVAVLSALYAVVLVYATTVRRDFAWLPLAWRIWFGALFAAGFALLLLLVMLPRRGHVAPRIRLAGGCGLGAAGVFLLLGVGFAEHAEGISIMPPVEAGRFFRHAWPCWTLGIITALMPIGLGLRALRGAVPVGARWIGFALGAAGGGLGGLVLHLHCPIAHWLHVSLAHGAVALIAGALTAAIAPRQLEP